MTRVTCLTFLAMLTACDGDPAAAVLDLDRDEMPPGTSDGADPGTSPNPSSPVGDAPVPDPTASDAGGVPGEPGGLPIQAAPSVSCRATQSGTSLCLQRLDADGNELDLLEAQLSLTTEPTWERGLLALDADASGEDVSLRLGAPMGHPLHVGLQQSATSDLNAPGAVLALSRGGADQLSGGASGWFQILQLGHNLDGVVDRLDLEFGFNLADGTQTQGRLRVNAVEEADEPSRLPTGCDLEQREGFCFLGARGVLDGPALPVTYWKGDPVLEQHGGLQADAGDDNTLRLHAARWTLVLVPPAGEAFRVGEYSGLSVCRGVGFTPPAIDLMKDGACALDPTATADLTVTSIHVSGTEQTGRIVHLAAEYVVHSSMGTVRGGVFRN